MMTEAILPGDVRLADPSATSRERRRFTRAALVSGLGHALVLALLIGLWRPEPEESPPPPIPVTLATEKPGASGAAGGGSGETAASTQNNASYNAPAFSTAQESQAQPQATPETKPPEPTAQPTIAQSRVAPELAPTPRQSLEPVPPRKPPTPPKPTPVPEAKPQPETESQPTQAVSPQVSVARPMPTPDAAASQSPASGEAQTQQGIGGPGRGEEGAGRAAVGDGSLSGTSDDYLATVRLWILRFKKVPDDDCAKKKEDVTGIYGFTIARDGTILNAWLERSSGCPKTDAEALEMVRAASPVPPLPPKVLGESKDAQMPFNFNPGFFDRLFH